MSRHLLRPGQGDLVFFAEAETSYVLKMCLLWSE